MSPVRLVRRFIARTLVWALPLAAAGVIFGDEAIQVSTTLRWLGFGLPLAAFPAGIAVASNALAARTGRGARIAALAAAVVVLGLLVVLLLGWAVPGAVTHGNVAAAGPDRFPSEPWRLSVNELTMAAVRANAEADRLGDDRAAWLLANHLTWHVALRTQGAVLLPLFAALGVLFGFCTAAIGPPALRRTFYWAAALLLFVCTYLVGENSYEMIVLLANGPTLFAGLLVLVPPLLLILGLGWPTLLHLAGRLPPLDTDS